MVNNIYKNKGGLITVLMFFMVIILFFAMILLLVGGIVTVKINNALDQNISLGQVNLQDINNKTFGYFTTMYLENADWWGISLIFGLVFGLFLSAYTLRNTSPKWTLIIDVFIIVSVFIFALYISSSYQTLLDALSSANESFLEDYTPKTSMFLLNLPIFSVIIGVVAMFLFHSSIPRKSEERYQAGGYLQGAY